MQFRLTHSARRRLWQRGGSQLALLGAAAFFTDQGLSSGRVPGRASSCQAMAGGAVLVRNGEASTPWLSKHSLLHDYAGAYTTARTVGRSSVFELSMHCQRLHDTAAAVLASQASQAGKDEKLSRALAYLKDGGPEALKPLVKKEVLTALSYLTTVQDGSADAEYQVTMLLTCNTTGDHTPDRGFDVLTFVQPLQTIESMVPVEAHRAARRNPTIKDVQWVNDRQQLEEVQNKAKVNEVLMYDASGEITEGLQTNFFAILKDGTLLTAPDQRVLSGTVRKVVLDVAREQGIPVRLECPNIKELEEWESCFICSTSRLVKPIRELGAPEFRTTRRQFATSGSMAHRVEELVLQAIRSHSESLVD